MRFTWHTKVLAAVLATFCLYCILPDVEPADAQQEKKEKKKKK